MIKYQNKSKRGVKMSAAVKKNLFIASFIGPTFLLYSVFFLYPNINSLIVSLYEWKATSLDKTFIGLNNYIRLFQDPLVLQSTFNTIFMAFFTIALSLIFSLFFSAVITIGKNDRLPESEFYRATFFIPNILSVVVTSILWILIYSPSFGIINNTLDAIGLGSLKRVWLGDPYTVKPALVIYQLWVNIGFFFVIFTSAIKNIPVFLYESASIDGAGKVMQFFRITLPLITGIIKTNLIFGISSAFNGGFAYVMVMTEGGPNHASEILPTYMYKITFFSSKFGYGASIGVLIYVITLALCYAINKFFSRGSNYEY